MIGACVGMLAGLTGVGGGVFLVPLLVGVLYLSQYEAHGTSLAVIFPMALFNVVGSLHAGSRPAGAPLHRHYLRRL